MYTGLTPVRGPELELLGGDQGNQGDEEEAGLHGDEGLKSVGQVYWRIEDLGGLGD